MKRLLVGVLLLVLAGLAGMFAWRVAAEDREFRRLVAQGDTALADDQSYVAIEAFSGALALRPDSMLAHLKRGETYRRRGELNAALRDLRTAATLDSTATRPRELLGDVNYALGRYARAADAYAQFIAVDDRSPHVLYKLGVARYRGGEVGGAIQPLKQAVALDARLAEAHYLLGVCLRGTARPLEAREAFERAIDLSPGFTAPREELADLYMSMGRRAQAIDQLEALAALEPARAERMIAVGMAYARTGRPETAVVTLGRAAERYPEQPSVYTALGRVWLELAELRNDRVSLGKALEALQPLATRTSAPGEALALYGRALFLSGDAAGAERMLWQATQRLPVDPAAFRHLAAASERLGRLAAARDALMRYAALVADPDEVQSLAAQVADLSLRVHEPQTAKVWAQKAIDRNHPDPFPLGLLADAQWRLGEQEAARATLAQALAKDPDSRALLALRNKIR